MKAAIDAILRRPQAEYLDSLLPARDLLLTEMELHAAAHGEPIADPEVAQLMRVLIRSKRPRHVLEIGTNIGYSVVALGRELDQSAEFETIELDAEKLATAREFVARAELRCEVTFHHGKALDVLPRLTNGFDFVFIDCVKTEYGDYLDALFPKLNSGALIVCDNLLWGGQVAEGARSEDKQSSTAALREFNARITRDPRLMTTILPVGDGVGISIVQ